MKKTIVLTLGLLLSLATTSFSQKFGYCNSVALLAELPEVKQADSDLQAFQAQLTKRGQQQAQELQAKAADLKKKQDEGLISPKEYETVATKLQEEQSKLQQLEQEIYDQLAKKREELYAPILEKVNKAMTDVSKENGYLLVFDSGSQILLYADETLDVTKLVKAKLGITN